MKFKVGYKVRNVLFPEFGIGVITEITENKIRVEYEHESSKVYDLEGKQGSEDKKPRLEIISKLHAILS